MHSLLCLCVGSSSAGTRGQLQGALTGSSLSWILFLQTSWSWHFAYVSDTQTRLCADGKVLLLRDIYDIFSCSESIMNFPTTRTSRFFCRSWHFQAAAMTVTTSLCLYPHESAQQLHQKLILKAIAK